MRAASKSFLRALEDYSTKPCVKCGRRRDNDIHVWAREANDARDDAHPFEEKTKRPRGKGTGR